MITVEHASVWYGQVIGVNDISCRIGPGLTALLGPNGAGKSTLIKLITGQLKPTTGRTTVLDQRPFANAAVMRRLGYCPELENCYDDMTGREFVTLMAALSGVRAADLKPDVEKALEAVGMSANAGRKIGGYSKGMRQRIKVAQGIVHDPDVLILDEPLNGLDPVGRRDISTLLQQVAARGKCVVISSHILYEVEQITSTILLLNHGRLLAQGDLHDIRNLIDSHPHRIAISTDDARGLAQRLMALPYVISARLDSGDTRQLEIETASPERFYAEFPDLILDTGIKVTRFGSPDNNLESVFRYLVTK